jgi:hypothetical protein
MVKDLDFATAAIEATDTQEAVNSADSFMLRIHRLLVTSPTAPVCKLRE